MNRNTVQIQRLQYTRFASAIHNSPLGDRSGSPILFIGFIYNSAHK
jgi:outer membrane scaffolding protein for murein synthesis (MipA/OmpV family)